MIKKAVAILCALTVLLCCTPVSADAVALSADYVELTQLGQTAYLAVLQDGAEVSDVVYASSNEKVAVVNHGVIMAMGNGSAVITAAYAGAEYTCAVKVASDFSVAIDGANVLNLKSGDTAALTAKVTLPTIFDTIDTVNWTSSNEAVATVDKAGVLTAVGSGIAVITAESHLQKTESAMSMMGVSISTAPATAAVTVIVNNEYTAEAYPELAGLYTGHYDWQGFTQDLKSSSPVWTADQFKWIRAILNLELNEDGTFRQEVLNAQRKGYAVDTSKLDGDTYEVQAAKYQKCYVYNRYTQIADELNTADKLYHDISGMSESGVNNFAEVGVFAILDGELTLFYKNTAVALGAAADNAWLAAPYVPFNNMVAMSENMTMPLEKQAAAEETAAAETAADETAEESKAEGTVYTGTANMTWHNTEVFTAIVDVTVKDQVITGVVVREGSYIDTGLSTFKLWAEGKDAYLNQYVGKSVQDILSVTVTPSANVDHYDGGKIEGCIDAVTGATASSTTIAMAVQNALEKVGK